MEPRSRINCGFPGVTQFQCREKGCCFDDTVIGYPWCFHPVPIQTPEPEDGMVGQVGGCLELMRWVLGLDERRNIGYR